MALIAGSFEQDLNKGDCFIVVSANKDKDPVYARLPCYPDQISESQTSNWATTQILSRSAPISAYNDTNYRSISVSFKIHRELGITMGLGENCLEQVEKVLRRSLYPSYAGKIAIAAPKTTLVLGAFKAKGYITSVGFTWSGPIVDHKYQVADISIQMTDISEGKVWSVGQVMPGVAYTENPFTYTSTWSNGKPKDYYK